MVMKVIRQRVCDICGDESGVCRFRITKLEGTSQQTTTVDLCHEHGGTVEQAMNAAPTPRRGRKSARPVVSLDQIEAAKKPVAKRTAKKAAAKKTATSRR